MFQCGTSTIINNLDDDNTILLVPFDNNGPHRAINHAMLDGIRYHLIDDQGHDSYRSRWSNYCTRLYPVSNTFFWRAEISTSDSDNFTRDIIDPRFPDVFMPQQIIASSQTLHTINTLCRYIA